MIVIHLPLKEYLIMMLATFTITGITDTANGQVFIDPYEEGMQDTISDWNYNPIEDEMYNYGKSPYFSGVISEDEYTRDLGLSDSELQERIEQRLKGSPFVNGNTITVQVEQGSAMLSGQVEDRSAMVDAVETAYDSGAENVINALRFAEQSKQPWRHLTDEELKDAVEDELFWSPFVNSDRIRVSVHNGVVTLAGRMENRGEIADAVKNAYEAGAKRVTNRLWTDPSLH
jgi:osmotically-inducible protein OsmY